MPPELEFGTLISAKFQKHFHDFFGTLKVQDFQIRPPLPRFATLVDVPEPRFSKHAILMKPKGYT